MSTVDQLEKAKKLAKELLELKKQGIALDLESKEGLIALQGLLRSSVGERENELAILQRKLKLAKEAADVDKNRTDSENKDLERQEKLISETKKLIQIQKSAAITELQGRKDIRKEIDEMFAKQRKAAAEKYKEQKREFKHVKDVVLKRQEEFNITKAIAGVAATFGAAGAMGEKIVASGMDIVTAKLFGFNVGLGNMVDGMKKLPSDIDIAVASMAKNTGLSLGSMQSAMIAALNPAGAQFAIGNMREQFQALGREGADVGGMLERVLSLEEVKSSFSALIKQSALFRQGFLNAQPAAASFITNLVGGLERVGVATSDSAEIFDFYNKAMRKSPVEAGKALLTLASISKTLGIETSTSFTNFRAVMDNLSQYGDKATTVFAKLQARSAITNVELSKLASIAEGMDDFATAGKAAQTLNAILGDTFINVTDLALAEPEEKFKLLIDGILDAGPGFEGLNRQMKQIIATAVGFDNVGDLQRQLANVEEIKAATDALDLNAMSMKDLNEQAVAGLNITEKQQRAIAATAAVATSGLQSARAAADVTSDAFAGFVSDTTNITQDPVQAFLATKFGVEGFAKAEAALFDTSKLTGGLKEGVSTALTVGVAGATVKALVDKAMGKGGQNVFKKPTDTTPPPVQAPQSSPVMAERTNMEIVAINMEAGLATLRWTQKVVRDTVSDMARKAGSP